jgi:AsmA protein
LLALLVLVVAAGAVFALSFDPDSLKPRIAAAVKRATGRELTIQSHMRLGLSLRPTLVVPDVRLANAPGFSRPDMIALHELDVQLALIPLLSNRVEINRLVLVKPDIILETNAQGAPNWQFTPESKPAASGSGGPSRQDRQTTAIDVQDLRVEDGTLTWRDGRTDRSTTIGLTSLHATAASPEANLHLTMSASYSGTPFSLTGEFGPPSRLKNQSAAAWPVSAKIETGGAKLDIDGAFTDPMKAHGYRMKVAATIPDLAALAPFMPGAPLPPLHDVSVAAEFADTGAALPDISALALHIGQSDLTATFPGLRLEKLDLAATHADQPMQVSAQASLDNAPVTLTGSIGTTAGLLAGKGAPIPLNLTMHALGSNLTVKGAVTPDHCGRPAVQADVASDTLDLDKVLAVAARTPTTPATAAAPSPPSAKPPAAAGHVIPDTPLPFAPLRLVDAEGQVSIAHLIWGAAAYRAVAVRLSLHDGKLRLDPVSADLPEGHLDGSLSVDASQANPPVALKLQSPSLAVQSLLTALKQPAYITGNLQVQADLHGAGSTLHAIAATLGGTLGLAMANGSLDNRLLGSTLGSILREINLLDLVGRGGTSEVQCFAARLDAANGIATLRSLVLVSSLLTMEGSGSLNLGAETLDLHVQPQTRIAGTGLVVPLQISGPFRSPSTRSDTAAAVTENAGTVAGTVLGKTNPLGAIAGALGAKQLLGGGPSVDCGPALGAARGGAGQVPTARSAPTAQPKLPNIGGALKQLFR